jgi:hypothetical protein
LRKSDFRFRIYYHYVIKKTFSHILAIGVNYYLLMLAIGTILMFSTVFGALYNTWSLLLTNVVAVIACITYQIKRGAFKQQTIGELIIGNHDKTDILRQNITFTITRIPLFILLAATLLLNGNLINGLTIGVKFAVVDIVYNTLVFFCIYYGFKNFFLRPDWLPLILICGGIFLAGFIFKTKQSILLFNIYYILGIVWLLVGIFYKTKAVYASSTPE